MLADESSTHVKPGVSVEVVDGMARGAVGKVKEAWPRAFAKGVPLWLVTFGGLIRQRVLREDYLRVVT